MNTARWVLALALAVGASTAAFANHCPVDMQQIDAALAANPKLSAEQLAEVKKLRAGACVQYRQSMTHGEWHPRPVFRVRGFYRRTSRTGTPEAFSFAASNQVARRSCRRWAS